MKTRFNYYLILILLCCVGSADAQNVFRFYENGKVGYKKTSGEIVVPAHYTAGSEMFGNYALVVDGQNRGYINDKGEVIIPFIYQDASVFSNGLAHVMKDNKNGYINIKGE